MTPRPRKPSVDSVAMFRSQVRALSILRDVLAYQLWRKSTASIVVTCRSHRTSLATTRLSELGAITGFDSKGSIAGDLVVPISSAGILLGGRRGVNRAGGIVEAGIGTDRSFRGGPNVPVFGTMFYDADSKRAGVGFMVMPIRWKRLNIGFGVASDGTIAAKIGTMSSMNTRTTTTSRVSDAECQ